MNIKHFCKTNRRGRFVQAILFALIVALVTLNLPAYANYPKNSEYKDPLIMDDFKFTALYSNGAVFLRWNPYVPEGFNFYKVIRSTVNSDPIYPEDGSISDSDNHNFTSFADINPPRGTVYYRVCSVAKPNRYCSMVGVIFNPGTGGSVVITTATVKSADIVLKGSVKDDYVDLRWTIKNGKAPNGYKIGKSTVNKNPAYPPLKGDTYGFIPDPDITSRKDYNVRPGITYYYRLCILNDKNKCDSYSNAIKVEVPADFIPLRKVPKILK